MSIWPNLYCWELQYNIRDPEKVSLFFGCVVYYSEAKSRCQQTMKQKWKSWWNHTLSLAFFGYNLSLSLFYFFFLSEVTWILSWLQIYQTKWYSEESNLECWWIPLAAATFINCDINLPLQYNMMWKLCWHLSINFKFLCSIL